MGDLYRGAHSDEAAKMASVKPENQPHPGVSIKTDPEFANDGISALPDEDIYEDAGDIDFTDARQQLYLMRLPNWLWKTWSELDDDAEIVLGTVRVEGGLENPKRLSLKLDTTPAHAFVPKEYNMDVTNETPPNTFAFTEKDFPGYGTRARGKSKYDSDAAARPFSQAEPRLYLDRNRLGNAKVDKNSRGRYRQRRAIPKKTTFSGQVKTEISCMPVENKDYRRIMEERARRDWKAPRQPVLLDGPVGVYVGNTMAPATIGTGSGFNTFVKGANASRPKAQEFKAARMPQNELLDLLFKCFKEWKHWHLKDIKARVQQPEAYLRQTLDMIAEMVKSGTYAGTWRLRNDANFTEYNADVQDFEQAQEGKAPDGAFGVDGASDIGDLDKSEDEDEVKMEDVMPA